MKTKSCTAIDKPFCFRLKETMRVMGLGNAVHWCSWFVDSFAVMFGSCILLTIILVVSQWVDADSELN